MSLSSVLKFKVKKIFDKTGKTPIYLERFKQKNKKKRRIPKILQTCRQGKRALGRGLKTGVPL